MIINAGDLVQIDGHDTLDPKLPIIGYENLLAVGSVSASDEDADYPATNLANPSTALRWQGADASPPDQYVTVIVDRADPIDYVAIAKHNFGTAAIAVSIEVQLVAEGAWTEIIAETEPTNDKPLLFRFNPTTVHAIRVRMQDGTAAPRMAVMYCGKLLVCELGVQVGFTPLSLGRMTTVKNGRSESGNFLGKIVTNQYQKSSPRFSMLSPDWYRTDFDPFVEAAIESPFFFAWNPGDYPDELGYAWLTGDAIPQISQVRGNIEITLETEGIS